MGEAILRRTEQTRRKTRNLHGQVAHARFRQTNRTRLKFANGASLSATAPH